MNKAIRGRGELCFAERQSREPSSRYSAAQCLAQYHSYFLVVVENQHSFAGLARADFR